MKAIIVGSAASLLKKKQGKKIDSFDYVIRPITCLLSKGYEEYVGTKTDMYWVTYQYLCRLLLVKNPVDMLFMFSTDDNYKEFFPLCRTVPVKNVENKFYFDSVFKTYKHLFKKCFFIDNMLMCRVNKELGFIHPHTKYQENKLRVSATSGINALFYVLNYMNFNEVYITGFDFYQTGFYWQPTANDVSIRPFPYKEKIFYNKLIKNKIIHEL